MTNFGRELLKDYAERTRPGIFLDLAREWAEKDRAAPGADETMQLANGMAAVAAGIAQNRREWPGTDNMADLAEIGFTPYEAEVMAAAAAYPHTENPGPNWSDECGVWHRRLIKAARALLA